MGHYIDMHCHILPGVDDGACDMEETRKMLHMAYDDGIRVIVATPHYHHRKCTLTPEELKQHLLLVRKEAEKISDKMRIFLGTEIYSAEDSEALLQKKKILTMANSRYVLVEFSMAVEYITIRNAMNQLLLAGYFPVIAHVERYKCVTKQLDRVRELVELGVYIQCNCSAITGREGLKSKSFTKKILKEGLVHFIGTDAHDCERRVPSMNACVQYIEKHFGADYAHELSYENPKSLIKNRMV